MIKTLRDFAEWLNEQDTFNKTEINEIIYNNDWANDFMSEGNGICHNGVERLVLDENMNACVMLVA